MLLSRLIRTAALAENPNYHTLYLAPAVLPGRRNSKQSPIPLVDIPFPDIDLMHAGNPISEILAAPEFQLATAVLLQDPISKRSLMSTASQVLIYALIRNQRPMHVFEIGTYRGGTTEVMARALIANGGGLVHTVGPFDGPYFSPTAQDWPKSVREAVRFYPVDSMAFYMRMEAENIRPGLVLVDGDHSYEFASFDIDVAARRLLPGGFIVVDNINQAGPFFAVQDFLEKHPAWIECGAQPRRIDANRSFDSKRSIIPETEIAILRSPPHYLIGSRPITFGEKLWQSLEVRGVTLVLAARPTCGLLSIQCVLRGFAADRILELVTETSVAIDDEPQWQSHVTIVFDKPLTIERDLLRYTVEAWFVWTGLESLQLEIPPVIF